MANIKKIHRDNTDLIEKEEFSYKEVFEVIDNCEHVKILLKLAYWDMMKGKTRREAFETLFSGIYNQAYVNRLNKEHPELAA